MKVQGLRCRVGLWVRAWLKLQDATSGLKVQDRIGGQGYFTFKASAGRLVGGGHAPLAANRTYY